ncbi:MAG: hypothetical protein ACK53Y_17725 [bacterium]
MSLVIRQYRYTNTSRKRVKNNSNKIALPPPPNKNNIDEDSKKIHDKCSYISQLKLRLKKQHNNKQLGQLPMHS